jgi:hypothetical protein
MLSSLPREYETFLLWEHCVEKVRMSAKPTSTTLSVHLPNRIRHRIVQGKTLCHNETIT